MYEPWLSELEDSAARAFGAEAKRINCGLIRANDLGTAPAVAFTRRRIKEIRRMVKEIGRQGICM